MYEDIPVNNSVNACKDLKLKPRVFLYCEANGEVFTLVKVLRFSWLPLFRLWSSGL
jgi:hypothetical protein